MTTKFYKTANKDRKWYLIDAGGQILGRVATRAAVLLSGKHKSTYTPNLDSGDNLIIINAAKVRLSNERKIKGKIYYHHSGYPGGLKKETFEEAMSKNPCDVLFKAIKGMMPRTKLGKVQLKRLRIYKDADQNHTQEIERIELMESVNDKQ